jgi:hypothetical protein
VLGLGVLARYPRMVFSAEKDTSLLNYCSLIIMVSLVPSRPALLSFSLLLYYLLLAPLPASAIKFAVPASKNPIRKCIWNAAHDGALVVITANLGPGESQRVDIEVVDRSEHQHMYLSKKGIRPETRLAITAHGEGDVGICFMNTLEGSELGILQLIGRN